MAVSYYTVLDGDTWESIANVKRIPVTWLQLANGADASVATVPPIDPGSLITIPDPPPPVCIAPGSDNTIAYDPPYLAAFGPLLEFVVRSYAPFDDFGTPLPGFGFEGDARGYSTEADATARISGIALFDVAHNTVTFRAFSNQSAFPALPFKYDSYSFWPAIIPHLQATATASPSVRGSGKFDADGRIVSIYMDYAGAMPLIPGAPDIDVRTTFSIRLDDDGTLVIETTMVGDGFPCAEAFVRLSDGRAVLLHHYEVPVSDLPWQRGFWSGPFTGPTTELPFAFSRSMGSTTTRIPAGR